MTMTIEDIQLAKALMPDMAMTEIAEKLEVSLHCLAYSVLDCDFQMPESVFRKRLKRGAIRLTEFDIERLCIRCDEYLPFTEEFWHKANRNQDGAHTHCRACELERKAELRATMKRVVTQ